MGKRVAVATVPETNHVYSTPTPARSSIRKRKRSALNAANSASKVLRLSGAGATSHYWHENDDEDSSSNDAPPSRNLGRNNQSSTKHANNSSILLNTSSLNATYNLDISVNESPKPVYTLRPSVVNGTILRDLTQKPWRLGRPIGKGNFGEIFLASDNVAVPVTNENAKFVVKIEPHSNGPLFVEIHCLMNTAKKANDEGKQKQNTAPTLSNIPPSGIPDYIASGSHYFGDARYRFLVLQRFDRDLHSLIKNCRVSQKSVLTLAIHIVNVLEKLHDKGYCHNDVKAQNLMISKCKYYKKQQMHIEANGHGKNGSTLIKGKYAEHEDEKQQTTDSGNSSEQEELNDEDTRDMDYGIKYKGRKYKKYSEEDYEDFDDGSTSHSNNSNSVDIYETPINKNRKRRTRGAVEFSGSNPVRSCRRQQRNSIYEEMVKSHYLRPAKRISYSEFFNEDASSVKDDTSGMHLLSSDDESEEFIPNNVRRTASKSITTSEKRLTRRQEKIAAKQQHPLHMIPANTTVPRFVAVEEERIFLIDFGLASKFMDNGVHRPFVMDQRRAHDGTLEFTSRDAHMGAHSRRSDLECLGYNLIFWSQGYLPWKEAATQHQQEKVHRAKEYLMTDVREMLKQIYGKQVPKFLGEFLHYVGQLAYHERPDYARFRRIFEREYHQMNYTPAEIMLDSHEIGHTCIRFKEEIENIKDIFEMNKSSLSIMKNMTVGTPFHERTLSNRVSPKNLRSKSDKKATKKKKFSWAEILSQDPDQIARERAEKEFDREEELSDTQQPAVRKYEGKPTYAILEVQQRMKMNGRILTEEDEQMDEDEQEDEEDENNSEEEDEQDEVEECEEEEENDDDDDDEQEDENEDENEKDTDTEEADEDVEGDTHSEGEDADSNVSEASEANARTKRTTRRTTRGVKTNNSVRKSSTVKCNLKPKKDAECKIYKVAATKIRTRRGTAKLKTSNEAKRGSATLKRSGRKLGTVNNSLSAASAAGENEHKTAKYRHIENNSGGNTGGGLYGKPSERRKRRCLLKTDTDELSVAGEDSNSNFSPDVRNLFNVWKKINNESIYFRGSNATAATAAAKHCKK